MVSTDGMLARSGFSPARNGRQEVGARAPIGALTRLNRADAASGMTAASRTPAQSGARPRKPHSTHSLREGNGMARVLPDPDRRTPSSSPVNGKGSSAPQGASAAAPLSFTRDGTNGGGAATVMADSLSSSGTGLLPAATAGVAPPCLASPPPPVQGAT